jgi:hypothetical protein
VNRDEAKNQQFGTKNNNTKGILEKKKNKTQRKVKKT